MMEGVDVVVQDNIVPLRTLVLIFYTSRQS